MNDDEYLHMRDIYYVVSEMHRMSLTLAPPYKPYIYELRLHRTFRSPTFRDQRKIIVMLAETNVIEILNSCNRYGKRTSADQAVQFEFKRTGDDNLRSYFNELLLGLTEADMNRSAIHHKEKLELVYEDGFIYVLTPLLKLRVNKKPLRSNSFPDMFFSYLIEVNESGIITRAKFPYPNSRGYDEVVNRAGFKGLVKKVFIPQVDKNKIHLLTEADVSLKNLQFITRQLLDIGYDPMIYESYLEGIE